MRKSLLLTFIALMLLLSMLFLGLSGVLKLQVPHVRSLLLNRKGNAFFMTENYSSAFDNYIKTLEFDPFSPETHLNLGLTYEAQQQAEKAQTSYQNSLLYAAEDADLQFMALFNSAQLLGKAKKIDPALELYQKALALRPDSKEVKTNIELLIQQQQQQQDGGKGEQDQEQKDKNDKKDQKDQKEGQDQKDDQNKEPQDQGEKEKDSEKDKGKDKDQPQQYGQNPKPQPKKFNSEELSESDVKKILAELKQQEQKIRNEFNRKEVKEQPREKDW